jgi:hypothetical protein
VTGVVSDETGVPLQGVRLLAMQEGSGRLLGVAQTDRRGRYTLVTFAGPNRVYAYAPGLRLMQRHGGASGHLDLTLTVDAEIETITIRSGRTTAFKLSDSLYPEALPPPRVAAILAQDYGIALAEGCFCPGDLVNGPPPSIAEARDACAWSRAQHACSLKDAKASPSDAAGPCPATTWARACMLPRYWWLRLLQAEPPNPTRRRSGPDIPTLWWYDAIRAMQEDDARVAGQAKGAAR